MDLQGRIVALYGRFSAGAREALARETESRGGRAVRDLTRRTDVLVVGERADTLIASGALTSRLEAARQHGKQIFGERAFQNALSGEPVKDRPILPLATALSSSGATADDALLLSAFDLITLQGDLCRFADAAVLKTSADLREAGCGAGRMVRIIRQAQHVAPTGRHKVVMAANGEPALQWDDGLTTLDGQGLLPLDLGGGGIEDLFEAAVLAQAENHLDEAARLFDQCARADRADAISIYNLGNIYLHGGKWDEAALAYRRALSRDSDLVEARYNLAQSLEASGRVEEAATELAALLETDSSHPDALFNLAQLRMSGGRLAEAGELYRRYLATSPPAEWAAKARKALVYCSQAG